MLALIHFNNIAAHLMEVQIDVINCSMVDVVFGEFPHCCSDAGFVETGELRLATT